MRDIKFRAWDGKRFVYECYIRGGVAYEEMDCYGDPPSQTDWIVEQYTGIKDKNGVEIFEGDVVQIEDYCPFIVEWEVTQDPKAGEYDDDWTCGWSVPPWPSKMKIIGNIHQNSATI
tara:strand:+ start:112 stop:462 length:351 start_codon:yes stop_codon:yes gene_type:complete